MHAKQAFLWQEAQAQRLWGPMAARQSFRMEERPKGRKVSPLALDLRSSCHTILNESKITLVLKQGENMRADRLALPVLFGLILLRHAAPAGASSSDLQVLLELKRSINNWDAAAAANGVKGQSLMGR